MTCQDDAPSWLISWNARSSRYDGVSVGSTSRTVPFGVDMEPGGHGTHPDASKEILQTVDDLNRGGGLVDRRGQGLGGDVDQLPDPERRVLVDGPRAPEVEAGQDAGIVGPRVAVDSEDRTTGGHVLTDPGEQFDHTVVRAGQSDQLARSIPRTVPSTPLKPRVSVAPRWTTCGVARQHRRLGVRRSWSREERPSG